LKSKGKLDAVVSVSLVDHQESYTDNPPQIRDKRICAVLKAMENDVRRSWTTQECARLVNLSSSHLRKTFKDELRRTPRQHLKKLRLRTAFTLLTTEFLSVKEVMHRVGINNHSHFVKDFKKAYGTVPSRIELLVEISD